MGPFSEIFLSNYVILFRMLFYIKCISQRYKVYYFNLFLRYLYVAEALSKKLHVYDIKSEGVVAPRQVRSRILITKYTDSVLL